MGGHILYMEKFFDVCPEPSKNRCSLHTISVTDNFARLLNVGNVFTPNEIQSVPILDNISDAARGIEI